MHSDELIRRGTMTTTYPRLAWAVAMATGLAAFAACGPTAAAQYTAVDRYAMPGASYFIPSYGGPISGAFGGQVVAGEMLWKPDGSATNLTPAEHFPAAIGGTDGTQQFGSAQYNELARRPVVWNGTAASATFLDQTGLLPLSHLTGAGGGQFVGNGNTTERGLSGTSALLWKSLTATAIELNPTNLPRFHSTGVRDTNGTQQVGSGYTWADEGGGPHALLWAGSADSAVDLHPGSLPGIYSSSAVATDGRQQVGSASFRDRPSPHAMLWSGTADSVLDLNPSGFGNSFAVAVANGKQVGYGQVGLEDGVPWNALLWSGTADSAVNLHQFLPADFNASRAYGIDDTGRVFGVAFSASAQQWHAVEWIPQVVPEPTSLALLIPLAAAALPRRRRRPYCESDR